jgi:hypothetical protein
MLLRALLLSVLPVQAAVFDVTVFGAKGEGKAPTRHRPSRQLCDTARRDGGIAC